MYESMYENRTFAIWITIRIWCKRKTPHQSCFLTAWPFKVSTLKLFVRAGIMKNAITVTSLWLTYERKKLHQSMTLCTQELCHTVHWYHSTNTHLLEADSWVWPKLPRRGQHLCSRTHTFQRWRGTDIYPGWSPGAWRSNRMKRLPHRH